MRNSTAEAHKHLEDIVGPITCLKTYSRYLRGSYLFRAPLEAVAMDAGARWPACLSGWVPTCIAASLKKDMEDLRVKPSDALGVESDLVEWNLLGVFYVLEGASLGAKLLYRDAHKLGLDSSYGARHLANQIGSDWRGYVARLDKCDDAELGAAQRSALSTFELAARAMREVAAGD